MKYNIPRIKKHLMRFEKSGSLKKVSIGPREVFYRNPYELLHSYYELLKDKIYDFKCENPAPRIIDCGANIGIAINFFKDRFPAAEIIAFEPDEQNFSLLEMNVQYFSGVQLNKKAVWVSDGEISFASEGTLSSRIDTNSEQAGIKVACCKLANYLIEKVDFLKMDIEGAEYDVLLDIKDQLHNVGCFFIEYHGMVNESYKLSTILSVLYESGFAVYLKTANDPIRSPYLEQRLNKKGFEVQFNIFAYRLDSSKTTRTN